MHLIDKPFHAKTPWVTKCFACTTYLIHYPNHPKMSIVQFSNPICNTILQRTNEEIKLPLDEFLHFWRQISWRSLKNWKIPLSCVPNLYKVSYNWLVLHSADISRGTFMRAPSTPFATNSDSCLSELFAPSPNAYKLERSHLSKKPATKTTT